MHQTDQRRARWGLGVLVAVTAVPAVLVPYATDHTAAHLTAGVTTLVLAAVAAVGVWLNCRTRLGWWLVPAALTLTGVADLTALADPVAARADLLDLPVTFGLYVAAVVVLLGAALTLSPLGPKVVDRLARGLDAGVIALAATLVAGVVLETGSNGTKGWEPWGLPIVWVAATALVSFGFVMADARVRLLGALLFLGSTTSVVYALDFAAGGATLDATAHAAIGASTALLALATLQPTSGRLPRPDTQHIDPLELRAYALYAVVAAAPLVALVVTGNTSIDPRLVAAYGFVFSGMALVRLKLLFDASRRAERRLASYLTLPLTGLSTYDPDGRWMEVNDRLCAILGRSREEVVTHRWVDLTHPDDVPAGIEAHSRLSRGESDLETLETRYLRPDGTAVWCRVGLSAVRDRRGHLDAIVTVVEDVDERHRASERLAQHVAFQDLITEMAEELVAVPAELLDVTVERALARVGGRAGAEHVFVVAVDVTTELPLVLRWDDPGSQVDATGLLPDPSTASDAARRGRAGLDALVAESERHGWQSLVVHPIATEPPVVGLAGLGTTTEHRAWDDETLELVNGLAEVIGRALARRAFEVEITHQALHDDLTGLANRVLFLDRLATALRQAERHRRFPSVLYVDLDRFKVINDSLGHDVGDHVLREVAARLAASVRSGDTAARLGGDEFAVLCLRTNDGDDPEAVTAEISRRILEQVARPVEVAGRPLAVSASIGVVHGTPAVTAATMLRDADVAMYRAKAAGRNRIETFTSAMHDDAVARLALESELRRALENDHLEVHYQVVYRLADHQPVGIEALVRWRHPTRGLLLPGEFLDVAADAGLDAELDRQVLGEATHTAAVWHEGGLELPVWVNISPGHAGRPEFVDAVEEALARSGLPAAALGLEITERALIGDISGLTASLARLRDLGVHLAIDDFGTGLLSLSLLRDLRIEDLKVDRSFIDSVTVGENDGEVVRSVVALAHSLGLSVVAEGTETAEQLAALTAVGCDRAQGYLLGRPVPFVELALVEHLELAPRSATPLD